MRGLGSQWRTLPHVVSLRLAWVSEVTWLLKALEKFSFSTFNFKHLVFTMCLNMPVDTRPAGSSRQTIDRDNHLVWKHWMSSVNKNGTTWRENGWYFCCFFLFQIKLTVLIHFPFRTDLEVLISTSILHQFCVDLSSHVTFKASIDIGNTKYC